MGTGLDAVTVVAAPGLDTTCAVEAVGTDVDTDDCTVLSVGCIVTLGVDSLCWLPGAEGRGVRIPVA